MHATSETAPPVWDIFCHVVDNWGDLGVCWRLCSQLVERGQRVRLWVDEASPLDWMAPGARQGTWPGIEVLHWPRQDADAPVPPVPAGDVLVEAFGCEIATHWVEYLLPAQPGSHGERLWLNLEYLSAEPYVERCHGLPSPVLSGPLKGRCKWFFYPGFTETTGGLLRETDLLQRQQAFAPENWLRRQGLASEAMPPGGPAPRTVSLFCYEPAALVDCLQQWGPEVQWLVTQGRAWQAVQAALRSWNGPAPRVHALPLLPQLGFDHLLWACDFNFVRGEDSLTRVLWAGKPFVWQLYPQHDDAHHAKLEAFLDWLDAPPSLRRFHRVWNGSETGPLPEPQWAAWRECALSARRRLLSQDDLVTRLLQFVAKKR